MVRGAEWTARFTTTHEGLPGNGAVREAMDPYDNEVGRRVALANPGASPDELADKVARGQHGMADPTPADGVMKTPAGDTSANGS